MPTKAKKNLEADRARPAMVENTNARGRLFLRISYVCMFLALISFLFLNAEIYQADSPFSGLQGVFPPPLLWGTFFFSVLAIIILRKKGKRHSAPRFVHLDSPLGVLYLRPFSEDTDWRLYYSWGSDKLPTAFSDKWKVLKFSLRLQFKSWRGKTGYEFGEILSELTKDIGHVAAIGEPESPPIPGADNVYVSNDTWKEQVLQLATGAKLVILTAGTTPGVIWEIENMLRVIPPSRLLLNIPGGTASKRRKQYAKFCKEVGASFPKGLPVRLKSRVFAFSDDWTPIEDSKWQPPAGTSAHLAWWMSRVMP